MIKNWKLGTLLGVLLYVLIFVEISILIFTPALAEKEMIQTILHLIILPLLVLLCGYLYFKKQGGTFVQGLVVGVLWLIVVTILDLIITYPLFLKPQGIELSFFYTQWDLWVGFLEVLVFAGLSALIFKKKV